MLHLVRPACLRRLSAALMLAVLACAAVLPARAQPAPPPVSEAADPPARVGRLSLANGEVDVRVEPQGDWVPAALNLPLSSGSALRTGAQSRAEVRIGALSMQLPGNTQLLLQRLADDALVLDVQRGNVVVNVPPPQPGERVEVHAGEVQFVPAGAASLHVVHAPGAHRVELRLFEGAGSVAGPAPLALAAGQQLTLDDRTQAVLAQGAAERSRFDDWAAQRAARMPRRPYVSPEMTGAEALDEHGAWRVDPRLGPLWFPAGTDVDWAPYRNGLWVWMAPWGWTWVDNAPWGFAPFHYGRWVFVAGRWGWSPGAYQARPVYAPALVGFYGASGGGTFTGGTGGEVVGWFPLAPGEVYRPGFAASARYVQQLNVSATTAPGARAATSGYRYAQTSFAATAVPRERFGGAPVAGGAAAAPVGLTPAALSSAGVLPVHGAPVPAPAPPPAAAPPTKQPERMAAAPAVRRESAPRPARAAAPEHRTRPRPAHAAGPR